MKEISAVLDATPVLLPVQFILGMAGRLLYLYARRCLQGCVTFRVKLESETIVEYNPDFESEVHPGREQLILDLLSVDPEQCVTKLERSGITYSCNKICLIKAIFVKERTRRTYKPKTGSRSVDRRSR